MGSRLRFYCPLPLPKLRERRREVSTGWLAGDAVLVPRGQDCSGSKRSRENLTHDPWSLRVYLAIGVGACLSPGEF